MITIPTGTDLSGLLLALILCSAAFMVLLILAMAFEQHSRILSYLFAVPALGALIAAVVILFVGNGIHQADFDSKQRAVIKQVQQRYALTVSKDQSSTLISGRQITLSDGTHVRLRFHDNKRKASLVVVRETPYPEATR
jgi:hypothetical protein